MNRREVLRLLGGVAALPMLTPLSPEGLWELGRATHARLAVRAGRTLDPKQLETVSRIAELILPETDTPGAISVRVPEFIDLILTEWDTAPERKQFLAGLADLDARSRRRSGRFFLDLKGSEQESLLESLDGVKGADGSAEKAFEILKGLTIYGYFTSEVVMKEVTREPVIPGRFDGCIPL
jgi:hypothetical protein